MEFFFKENDSTSESLIWVITVLMPLAAIELAKIFNKTTSGEKNYNPSNCSVEEAKKMISSYDPVIVFVVKLFMRFSNFFMNFCLWRGHAFFTLLITQVFFFYINGGKDFTSERLGFGYLIFCSFFYFLIPFIFNTFLIFGGPVVNSFIVDKSKKRELSMKIYRFVIFSKIYLTHLSVLRFFYFNDSL